MSNLTVCKEKRARPRGDFEGNYPFVFPSNQSPLFFFTAIMISEVVEKKLHSYQYKLLIAC